MWGRAHGRGAFLLAWALLLAYACGIQSSAPSPPLTLAPTEAVGYLEGRATVGPLTPVEKVGVPLPTPSPAVCTSRALAIRDAKSNAEVTSFSLQADCTYRVALRPGTYVINLMPAQGISGSEDLPRTVEIESGKTVRLDISIDTGIR